MTSPSLSYCLIGFALRHVLVSKLPRDFGQSCILSPSDVLNILVSRIYVTLPLASFVRLNLTNRNGIDLIA